MLESSLSRLKLSAMLAGLLLATGLSAVARSEEPKLSISGYDPVAYFTDGKPVQGRAEIEYLWHKLRWRFASDAHRDLFSKTPDRYAPIRRLLRDGRVERRGRAQGHRRSRGLGDRRR